MKKFKVDFSWYASMRGDGEVIVEAKDEAQAKAIAWEFANIDYNDHVKIINNEFEVDEVTEV